MARRHYRVEQIIITHREVENLCNQSNTISEAARQAGITEQTYYRWRKEYSGMKSADARRMNELEKENARLKRLVVYERSFLTPNWHKDQGQTTGCSWIIDG